MAALAYLLLPVTGLVAYLSGRDPRTRFHGLQAITIGLLWPVALYAASIGPPIGVQVVFVVGFVTWAAFLVATLMGRDPRLPGLGHRLEVLSVGSVRDERRSTSGS